MQVRMLGGGGVHCTLRSWASSCRGWGVSGQIISKPFIFHEKLPNFGIKMEILLIVLQTVSQKSSLSGPGD